tara:strand:- start:90 stop:779 length:690 start_codon:yes stop_codon:yes gene_type:complete
MDNKIVALVRVSTDKQDVESQKFKIRNAYPNHEIIFYEEELSGALPYDQRPQLELAVKEALTLSTTLVVAELSRLGREAGALITWLGEAKKRGLEIMCLDYPDITPEMLPFIVGAIQFERLKMIERTVLALQAKKHQAQTDGFFISKAGKKVDKLGNPRIDCARVLACAKVKSNADNFAKKILNIIEPHKGKTTRQIAQLLNEIEVPTRRGGKWYPSTVNNILRREAVA